MTEPERLQLVSEMQSLRNELRSRPDLLVKDLPTELQVKIRSQTILGPITSSGIEHVESVVDRIIWATYYLGDPDFPQRLQGTRATEATVLEQQPPAQPTSIRQSSGTGTADLDFGPFDPRSTNNG